MYDIIFVGSGIAGCYTTSLLPKNLNILLLEKDKKVLPKDSGIVSSRFKAFIDEPKLIKKDIEEMECVSPTGKTFSLVGNEPYAYILRRRKFSRYLRSIAGKKAEIRYEAAIDVISRKDSMTVRTSSGEYDAKMVVGCDGASSLVRRKAGISSPSLSAGIMVKTKFRMKDKIQVFFNKYYSPDYFSWIIPQNKEYGTITAIRPSEYLRYFANHQSLPRGKVFAHVIPMGTTKSFANRLILIGDACGQNKPLTGGGIVFSLTASKIAAGIIKDAFEMKKFNSTFLSHYERLWKSELLGEINRQKMARKIYRKLTNKQIDRLFDDFGRHIEAVKDFDYDKFSLIWGNLPKRKLMRFAFLKLGHVFS